MNEKNKAPSIESKNSNELKVNLLRKYNPSLPRINLKISVKVRIAISKMSSFISNEFDLTWLFVTI